MYRLARPAVELYALTGDHMNNDLQRALKGLWVSDGGRHYKKNKEKRGKVLYK